MSVIKINAITVAADSGDELAHRFAARAGAVDGQDGFEGFELLRPSDPGRPWLVVTHWRDEASFSAWTGSRAFAEQHAHRAEGAGPPPLGISAELWSYEVAQSSPGPAV